MTCQNGTWATPVLECGNSLSVPLESNLVLEHQTKQQEKEKAARQPTTSLYTSILQPTTSMPNRNRVKQNPPETVIKTENTQKIPGGVSVPGGSKHVNGHYFSHFVSLLPSSVQSQPSWTELALISSYTAATRPPGQVVLSNIETLNKGETCNAGYN